MPLFSNVRCEALREARGWARYIPPRLLNTKMKSAYVIFALLGVTIGTLVLAENGKLEFRLDSPASSDFDVCAARAYVKNGG